MRVRQRLVDGFDSLEQSLIEEDGVGRRSQLRLPLALERLIRGVGDALARDAEHAIDAIEHAAGAFHRRNRVFKGRWHRSWRRWRRSRARCSASAASNAPGKCSGAMRSHGGTPPYGPGQGDDERIVGHGLTSSSRTVGELGQLCAERRREKAGLDVGQQLLARVGDVEIAHRELPDAILRREHATRLFPS